MSDHILRSLVLRSSQSFSLREICKQWQCGMILGIYLKTINRLLYSRSLKSQTSKLYISVNADHNLEALAWVHLHQNERRGCSNRNIDNVTWSIVMRVCLTGHLACTAAQDHSGSALIYTELHHSVSNCRTEVHFIIGIVPRRQNDFFMGLRKGYMEQYYSNFTQAI